MNHKVKGSFFLIAAVVFEVISTTNLKLAEGFTVPLNTVIAAVAIIAAMYFLGKSLNFLPLSVAYAIWVGLGTALIYLISIFLFNEPVSLIKFIGVLMVIGGVVSLQIISSGNEKTQKANSN